LSSFPIKKGSKKGFATTKAGLSPSPFPFS